MAGGLDASEAKQTTLAEQVDRLATGPDAKSLVLAEQTEGLRAGRAVPLGRP